MTQMKADKKRGAGGLGGRFTFYVLRLTFF